MDRANELAAIVRNAQQRIQLGSEPSGEEIRGEFYASLRALMAQVREGAGDEQEQMYLRFMQFLRRARTGNGAHRKLSRRRSGDLRGMQRVRL